MITETKKKDNRGGPRPNAGRKKVGDSILYCRMSKGALETLKERANDASLPVGIYITKKLGLQ